MNSRKDPITYTNTQKQQNGNNEISFNINTECKRSQLPHQKKDWQIRLKKQDLTIYCLQETHLTDKNKYWLSVKGRKDFLSKQTLKQAEVDIFITEKVDFNP
jgi:hypothetical protein